MCRAGCAEQASFPLVKARKVPENKRGRPTDYREEYCEQAYKLALLGLTDVEMAWFYDISIETLAAWAWEHEAFFSAITPTPEQRSAHAEKIAARCRKGARYAGP